MNLKNFTLSIILFCFHNLSGQITKELLESKTHPIDSSAHACYISKNVEIEYDFGNRSKIMIVSDYHFIIKVYDEEGESNANFEISYYKDGGSKESVRNIKAISTNLENGKMVTSKLDKKDIYDEQSSEKWYKKKFAVPNVKAGSIIELKYSIISPYIRTIPKWYFQNKIPTNQSIFKIKVPHYFTLTPVPTGIQGLNMTEEEVYNSKHGEVLFRIEGKDLPAIKPDKYVLNENDYRSGIKYEIMSTQFPNGVVNKYSSDWLEIGNNLLESKYFGKQISKKLKSVKPIIDQALKLTHEDRVKFLYEYVRTEYTWNEYIGIYSEKGLKEIIEQKSGTVGDLNLLLLNLLNACEIESYPLTLSSRASGILNTNFPSISRLNYLLVYIPIGEDYMILDASSSLTPMGQIPIRGTNINGIIIQKDASKIIDLQNRNKFVIQTVSKYTIDLENNKLIGTSQRKRSNQAAISFRKDLEKEKSIDNQEIEEEEEVNEEENENEQDDDIESFDIDNKYTITDLKNVEDIYKPIVLSYDEELNSDIKKIGDQIFINATLDFGISKNPFEEESRDYPIFYNYQIQNITAATIEIPEGYKIESYPEEIAVALPDQKGSFRYNITVVGKNISIVYRFNINETTMLNIDYPSLKIVYQMIEDLKKEKIILSKI